MINQVYLTLQTILNKENRGYVSPSEFNLLAKQVQDKIFRSYFEDENRDKNRENKGLSNRGYSDLPFNQRQRIEQFVSPATISIVSGKHIFPSDLYLLVQDTVISGTRVVEEKQKNESGYSNLSISAPSVIFPVYEAYEDGIIVSPATTADLSIKYIRTPKDPNWTYTIVQNKEIYNPSSSSHQDFELHPSEFSNIVIEMGSYFGINLREERVVQIMEHLKNVMSMKDNDMNVKAGI